VQTLEALHVEGVRGDLVEIDERQLAVAMRGCDVVVFSAGAGDADSEAMTDAIDGAGVSKSSAAARLAGIKPFYLVSVFPEAWRDRPKDESFEHYIAVKKASEVELSESDLDWVIVRPSALLDERGVGRVNLGVARIHTEIRRDDVAQTLVELIHTPAIRRQILEITEGPAPISEAVAFQAEWARH